VTWESTETIDLFRGGHTGYRRLASPVTHVREIAFDKTRERFFFRDVLDGRETHDLVWRFHLDPFATASCESDGVHIVAPAGDVWFQVADSNGLELNLERGWVSASYGIKTETSVIVLRGRRRLPTMLSYCFSARPVPLRELTADPLAVWSAA
jgi:hypothetical protein